VQPKRWSFALVHALAIVAVALIFVHAAWAKPKFKVLAGIPGGLWSGLTFDSKGNLYGVTSGGGTNSVGSVFELSRDSKGKWSVTTLHSFDGKDGSSPNGGLIFDAAGNLYGTTSDGGAYYDGGTVFELSPGSDGWSFSVLHSFCEVFGCSGGGGPLAGLIQDKNGNLLGTARAGLYDLGVVFELTPGSNGWTYSVLYNFGSRSDDGSDPMDAPALDAKGNIYGTTSRGGRDGFGTVFELTPGCSGWCERLLRQFDSKDGANPEGSVVFDGEGNLYSTANGRTNNVFELSPTANGSWKETVLYDFPKPGDGDAPISGPALGVGGILYGTTALGGDMNCDPPYGCGVVYELAPRAGRKWKYTVLYKFSSPYESPPDGALILDAKGNLYGTGFSVVYEVTP
jgi:uncharacterized repeat protein (TIGR03803 family)